MKGSSKALIVTASRIPPRPLDAQGLVIRGCVAREVGLRPEVILRQLGLSFKQIWGTAQEVGLRPEVILRQLGPGLRKIWLVGRR